MRQGIAESLILALGGGTLGIVFGYWQIAGLPLGCQNRIPEQALRGIDLQMNWRVAAFTAGVALVCAVLFGLAPAFEGSAVDLRSAAAIRSRQRDVYAVAQVALSLALLVAAGLLVRALERTAHIDPRVRHRSSDVLRVFTPQPDFTPENSTRLFTRLLAQARALPGVTDATLSFGVLGFGDGTACQRGPRGRPPDSAGIDVVEPNYFNLMRMPLVRGRNFPARERADCRPGQRAVAVDHRERTMARQRWPGQDPVGKMVWLGCREGAPRTAGQVIAVARD